MHGPEIALLMGSPMKDTFYRDWIVANGWAEAAGLGTTLVAAGVVAERLESDLDGTSIVLSAVANYAPRP